MVRVAAVQTDPLFGDVAANLRRAGRMIRDTPADLYVLPELFNTGYFFRDRQQVATLAEEFPGGESCRFIAALSRETQAVIVAGFAERSRDGRIYNAAMVCERGRTRACYRKIQLFDRECDWFDAGDRPPRVVATAAGRVGPLVCFDWIYPELTRSLALDGVQIVTHVANLVLPYCQDATVTRCIENRVFSVLANRVGSETREGETLGFTGRSQITSPGGDRLAVAPADREAVIVADIEARQADDKQVTARNDLLRGRRPGLYRRLWD